MWDLIDALEADAQNPQVDRLVSVLKLLQAEIGRLEARNRKLEDRLSRLEAVNGLDGTEIDLSDANELDHRDEKVVKAIVADGGTMFSVRDLQRFYREHTDVRAKETLKDRIQYLTSTGLFERDSGSKWRFVGADGF
ncbi:hypothetical protein [Halobiforma nitratireducens]|uniref:Uncharacterized protein n=1 Tax=Halobiforma nitratireducens JCM 10879 TaxID=1227454 RepID=M0MME0_9EURY|nr:hypothetical protein [Halobiforma nitratireducens]EMA45909.1 hypothetical protein C446_01890 [Halobiforma nitratireducens JCM 10879]